MKSTNRAIIFIFKIYLQVEEVNETKLFKK